MNQRDATRNGEIPKTIQHLPKQNETNQRTLKLILSQARLPIPPQGPRADYSGRPVRVNGEALDPLSRSCPLVCARRHLWAMGRDVIYGEDVIYGRDAIYGRDVIY